MRPWGKFQPVLVLVAAAPLVLTAGCPSPGQVATAVILEELSEDDPDAPATPILEGWEEKTSPCVFDFVLESSGSLLVASYRQTAGEMPPGYRLVIDHGREFIDDAKGRFEGPEVGAGRWTAMFVAVDIMGNESSARAVDFICN